MADDLIYRSQSDLTLDQLKDFLSRVFPDEHRSFRIADGDLYFKQRYRALPDLPKEAKIGRVQVVGRLLPLDVLVSEFDRLHATLRELLEGREVGLDVTFEIGGHRQLPSQGARVGITLDGGASGSFTLRIGVVGTGTQRRKAAREIMLRVCDWGRFPVRFVDEGESFRLEPKEAVSVQVRDANLGNRNPGGFSFPVNSVGLRQAIGLLGATVEEFGSGKIFKGEWVAGTDISQGDAGAADFYRHVRAGRFKADSFELFAVLRASTVDELEAARGLCIGKTKIECEIGSIALGEDNYATVEVVARQEGYRVQLVSRLPIDIEGMGRELGLRLVEAGLA